MRRIVSRFSAKQSHHPSRCLVACTLKQFIANVSGLLTFSPSKPLDMLHLLFSCVDSISSCQSANRPYCLQRGVSSPGNELSKMTLYFTPILPSFFAEDDCLTLTVHLSLSCVQWCCTCTRACSKMDSPFRASLISLSLSSWKLSSSANANLTSPFA